MKVIKPLLNIQKRNFHKLRSEEKVFLKENSLMIFGFISGGVGGISFGVQLSEEESIPKQIIYSTGTGILGAVAGVLIFNPIIFPVVCLSTIFVFSNKIISQKK